LLVFILYMVSNGVQTYNITPPVDGDTSDR